MLKMLILSILFFNFAFIEIVVSVESQTQSPRVVKFFWTLLQGFTGKTGTPKGIVSATRVGRIQKELTSEFPCDTRNGRFPERPTSVHQLRPGDIDVIASMGDSLSVGNGLAASQVPEIVVHNRGLSWVIGGRGTWRTFLTLPNILKKFNPNLVGYAVEDSFAFQNQARFSVSEPGAMSRDMPYSARVLIQRIKNDPQVNFENDWKLINFHIGGNDFCVDVCYLSEKGMRLSGEQHRRDLIQTFDYIRDNMPRTLINLILAPRTEIGTEMVGRSTACIVTHRFECPCIFGEVHKKRATQMHNLQTSWLKVQREVGEDERYKTKDDFAIVVQPFVPKSRIPKLPNGKTDFSYVSTDCFHFSQKGGALAASALWNNMLEPLGNKTESWESQVKKINLKCPNQSHPYIYTWKNSGLIR